MPFRVTDCACVCVDYVCKYIIFEKQICVHKRLCVCVCVCSCMRIYMFWTDEEYCKKIFALTKVFRVCACTCDTHACYTCVCYTCVCYTCVCYTCVWYTCVCYTCVCSCVHTLAHTHIYTYIYIYMYNMCVCVCVILGIHLYTAYTHTHTHTMHQTCAENYCRKVRTWCLICQERAQDCVSKAILHTYIHTYIHACMQT